MVPWWLEKMDAPSQLPNCIQSMTWPLDNFQSSIFIYLIIILVVTLITSQSNQMVYLDKPPSLGCELFQGPVWGYVSYAESTCFKWEGHDVLCRHSRHIVFLLEPQSLERKWKVRDRRICTMYPCMKREVFTLTKSLFPEALLPPRHSVYLLSRLQNLRAPPHSYRTDSGKFVL